MSISDLYSNKPDKYGIKVVILVDTSPRSMVGAKPHLGSFTKTDGVKLDEFYVKRLTNSVHGTNKNVTVDNSFTSVPLAKNLVKEADSSWNSTSKQERYLQNYKTSLREELELLCSAMIMNLPCYSINRSLKKLYF